MEQAMKRLRGVDAVDTLIEHLRLRLLQEKQAVADQRAAPRARDEEEREVGL